MELKNIRGKVVNKNVVPYLIDWDGPSLSKFQFNVKQFFKPFWIGHVVFEEFPVFGSRLRVDILNATKMIAVEVNGDQHSEYVEFFHQNEGEFFRTMQRDILKIQWLESNRFRVIEIVPTDLPLSPESIFEKFEIEIL